MKTMKRMWINQPSTLQTHHKLHAKNILADIGSKANGYIRVYFVAGEIISQQIEYRALSRGWLVKKEFGRA